MSTISASTLTTTALVYTADTTGALVFKTGATPTTALTLAADQSATFAGTVNFATAGFTNLSYTGTFTGGTGVVNLGSGQFYKDASGNVLIGTTSTFGSGTYGLRVSNTATNGFGAISLQGNRTTGEDTAGLLQSFNSSTEITRIAFIQGANATSGQIIFNTASTGTLTERMRINSTGNVGIGVNPVYKLDVASKFVVDTTNTYGKTLFARYTDSALSSFIQGTDATGTANGLYLVYGGGSAQGMAFDGGNIIFYNNSNTTERMRITSDGKVGIGIGSPAQSWTGGASQVLQLQGPAATVTVMRVNESGATYGDLQLVSAASATTAIYNFANGPMRFGTNSTEQMRIDSSGNVGIGTTSPNYKLDVRGSIGAAANITVEDSSNTYGFVVGRGFITSNGAGGFGGLAFKTYNGGFATQMNIDGNGVFAMNSGYGSAATAYGVRAWVNFDGSSGSIRNSGGVSSVTRSGVGIYTVNLSFTMPSDNFAFLASADGYGGSSGYVAAWESSTTTSVGFSTWKNNGTRGDSGYIFVGLIR
jgi:hypothetical protein